MTAPADLATPRSSDAPSAARRRRNSARELIQARELTLNLVRRDLKVRHRQTFLGMLWSLATPLLTVALYYFVFRVVMGASPATDVARPDGHIVPFAVYFFAGLTLWNFFNTSVSGATTSITGSTYLINKVYFPRAILPLSTVLASLVTLSFEFAALMVVTIVAVGLPSAQLLWVPVIVAVIGILAYGLALLLSAVTVFLRDVAHFIGILMQVWFWATPIIYSLSFVQKRPGVVLLLKLNPITGSIVSFRNVVVLNHAPAFGLLAYDLAVGVVALALGAWIFGRSQRLFAEIA
ncbi:MAG: ABC transporter permease [Actinomycetota bacterium]|nr:ABC transporter permease [Actinomycetota bacterium]